MVFPPNFIWGAATSSYQIEGAALEDGKGLSVWDTFCRQSGKVVDDDTGLVACDHYHRYPEDIALMKTIGLQAYRFSIAWPRVLPAGIGQINQNGLDFYDRLVDRLLEVGIEPWVTLFHWDYPYELYCRGGWLSPDSSSWFAEFTQVIVDKLSDRVSNWLTLNEPQCFIGLGHDQGVHAPGDKLALPEILRAAHNSLLAHGKATQVIRARSKRASKVGFAPVAMAGQPATNSPEDIEALRTFMFSVRDKNIWNNSWWADPILKGCYPEDGLRVYGEAVPAYTAQDMQTINQPIDFYAMNLYSGATVRAGADGKPETVKSHAGHPKTLFHWDVKPEALYWAIRLFHEEYKLPVVVSENGMANPDWIAVDGKVHDPQRIDYLTRYIGAMGRAIEDGATVQAYFHWSLMDNFEWAEGYRQRFGLIYVDYPTGQRTLKDSALWYSQLIQSNGAILRPQAEETLLAVN